MRADIRLWTAIALIGICGFSVARGWGIVHFSLAMANIDSSEKRAEIINTWSSAPDVASAALQAELTEKINISDPKAANSRREALSSILSIKPSGFGRLAVAIRCSSWSRTSQWSRSLEVLSCRW